MGSMSDYAYDEDTHHDYPCEDDDNEDDECMAFGGNGCRCLRCSEWGGDGLCLVDMRAGYGHV